MNRLHRLLAGLGIAAISLTACGGGGSATPAVGQSQLAGSHPIVSGTAPPSLSQRTVIGSAKLTLSLPKILTAKAGTAAIRAHVPAQTIAPTGSAHRVASAKVRAGASAATRRTPKFIDPSCGPSCYPNVLDIYVDGTLIPDLDSQGESDSLYVQPTADGTQTITVPIFSSSTNDIVAVEWDYWGDYVLAMGENDRPNSFAPGTTQNITLTMLMNTASVGIVDAQFNNPPQLLSTPSQPYYGLAGNCSNNLSSVARRSAQYINTSSVFALYATDGLGNFVPTAGYGGTSTPQIIPPEVPDNGGGTKVGQSTIAGLYLVNWDNSCNGVTITASTVNPAYAITTDVFGPSWYTGGGSDSGGPFSANGGETWGYWACYNGSGQCPGGPYQGIWNLEYYSGWYHADPITGYCGEGGYGGINGPTAGGSVDIENTYPAFTMSPSSVSLLAVGQQATVTVEDPLNLYDSTFIVQSIGDTSVATTTAGNNCCGDQTQFVIQAVGAGTTTITFADYDGRTYPVQVTVTTTTLPIQ